MMVPFKPVRGGGALPFVTALAVVLAACGGDAQDENVLARAGEYVLTVDDAAELLVDQENLPNDAQVVRALANLWIDYTLLGDAAAHDSTFASLELEDLVRPQVEQEMILALRDSVVEVDTTVTEDELRSLYATEAPGAEIRARHILLGYPQGSTQAQRDSVRGIIEDLRRRALNGESFADLARAYSQDPGSAAQGGDLGFFQRGEMVRPFDDAAFALQPGEISDVVETPYGLHIIRLEERRARGFDEVREEFRRSVLNRRQLTAESTFVAGIEAGAEPTIEEGAVEVVRELAGDVAQRLSGRAAARALVRFRGGALTAGEFLAFLRTQSPQFHGQAANATDEQLENLLKGMAQRKLLVQEARERGLDPAPEHVDSLVQSAQAGLRDLARDLGILAPERAPGEALAPALTRAVRSALVDVLSGAENVVPLGQISYRLRERVPITISEAGIGQVVLRVGRTRAARGPSPAEEAAPLDTAAADSVGR